MVARILVCVIARAKMVRITLSPMIWRPFDGLGMRGRTFFAKAYDEPALSPPGIDQLLDLSGCYNHLCPKAAADFINDCVKLILNAC